MINLFIDVAILIRKKTKPPVSSYLSHLLAVRGFIFSIKNTYVTYKGGSQQLLVPLQRYDIFILSL